MKIKLIDGPYAGVEVEAEGTGAILMEGEPPDGSEVPAEGAMARYRPTRNRSEYRFKGWDESVLRIPLPGSKESK